MLSPFEAQQMIDQQAREQAFKARPGGQAQPPTPGHAAAEAALGCAEVSAAGQYAGDADGSAEAQRRRARVQHEVDPFAGDDDGRETDHMDEAALADLGKRFRGSADVADIPAGYPPFRPVSAEQFRDGPVTADHASYGAGYRAAPRVVPVPQGTLSAAAITRPLMTDGRSSPCAEG